jgi:CubicO group peptidase (beta-lactamase class C family)
MKLTAGLVVMMTLTFRCCSSRQSVSNGTSESRADGVERNLAGMYFLEGNAPQRATLSQRMADLHVPGVTIAAIDDGKIDWARGYGVAAINGPAVTRATHLQPTSMSGTTVLSGSSGLQTGLR